MASMWIPEGDNLAVIYDLLERQMSPSSDVDRSQFRKMYRHLLDFNNYLVFILVRGEGKSVELRQAAGLLLKNNLRGAYPSMSQENQKYIKTELLLGLGAVDRNIRTTVGTIISVVHDIEGVTEWPELFRALVTCLDSDVLTLMDGAMDALSKIFEDRSEVPGVAERIFLPKLYELFQSPHPSLRKLALGSVNQCMKSEYAALYYSMDEYFQRLFLLANDPVADIRKLVCAAFVNLTQVLPSSIQLHLTKVMEYMLQYNKDPDKQVALKGCEFWSVYCDAQFPPENLQELLPLLIPVLLSNMAYADDDESLLDAQEDESQPDRDQDMKPRFHTSRLHGSEDFDDDDDDSLNVWNLRKCSAAAIDVLSNVFGDEILHALLPLIQAKLSVSGDKAWKDREAAVLALGAIAEGCMNGLNPHLSEIVTFLLPLLDDKFPLIRSISCWTLSRFGTCLILESGNTKGYEQFEKVLIGLLRRLLDTNKRVQEAACSAFVIVEKDAGEVLVPHLRLILDHLMPAFEKYQMRNLPILYDAIGTLADSVKEELNKPVHLDILLPPLVAKLQQLSDSEKDLFALLNCFTAISQFSGVVSVPFLEKCMNLVRLQWHTMFGETRIELPSPNAGLMSRAADIINHAARNDPGMITRIRDEGGISPLVGLLYVADDTVQRAAAGALRSVSFQNQQIKNEIVERNGLRALVLILRSKNSSLHGEAIAVIKNLVPSSPVIKRAAIDAGAVQPVINLLSSPCLKTQAEAAFLTGHFAAPGTDCLVRSIAQRGGTTLLINMLQSSDEQVMEASAYALGRLAKDHYNRAGIGYQGGITLLMNLLRVENEKVQYNAAFALYRLAKNEENAAEFIKNRYRQKLQGEFSARTNRCVEKTLKKLEHNIRQQPVQDVLIYMMRTMERRVQTEIALSLAYFCERNDNKGVKFLLELLDSTSIEEQICASKALFSFVKKATASGDSAAASSATQRDFLSEEDFNNSSTSDVTLVVEGQQFHAQKSYLIASSDVFGLMLDGSFRENNAQYVNINDLKWGVFEVMMRFIHMGRTNTNIPDSLNLDVWAAATKYNINGLKHLCEFELAQGISVEEIESLYEFTESFDTLTLREACVVFGLDHFIELSSQDWFIEKVIPEIRSYITRLITQP